MRRVRYERLLEKKSPTLDVDVLTNAVEAGVINVQGLAESDTQSRWLDENGQITSEIIHHEKKDAHGGRSHAQGNDFHNYREKNSEPHFSCEIKQLQRFNYFPFCEYIQKNERKRGGKLKKEIQFFNFYLDACLLIFGLFYS